MNDGRPAVDSLGGADCDLPSERRRVGEIAAEASAQLEDSLRRLSPAERARIERVPLEPSLAAVARWSAGHHYYEVPRAVSRAEAAVTAEGEPFVNLHRALLLYSLLANLDYGIIVKRADVLSWADSPAAHPELES